MRKDNQWVHYKGGTHRQRKTTVGWKLWCLLSDGTYQWFDLKDLKQSNPMDVARYVLSNNIADEPAFKWWVPYTMRKADAIAKVVIKRLRATRTKFGLKILSSLEECKEFDKENGNTYWILSLPAVCSNLLEECQTGYD